MKLNIVPGIEKRSMYFKYFKIDSILELYAEQKIIIGKIKVKNKEWLNWNPLKKLESGFTTFVKRVINIPKIIIKPLGRIIFTLNFFSKGPDII